MDGDYDIVIAGGGLAGLTAGVTAARLGRKTLVLTGDVIGGQLLSIEKIEGYPGFPDGVPGYDLAPMTQEEAASAGAEFAATELTGFMQDAKAWRLSTGEGEVSTRGVVLATGSSLKELGVPGEARLRGQGVSHCASCDAPLLRQKIVAVVGGGDFGNAGGADIGGSRRPGRDPHAQRWAHRAGELSRAHCAKSEDRGAARGRGRRDPGRRQGHRPAHA